MTKQLFVKVPRVFYPTPTSTSASSNAKVEYYYRPATPPEIDEAAGVTELRQQHDRLLDAAEALIQQLPMGYIYEGAWNIDAAFVSRWDELQAAVAICEPEAKDA